jgi:ureidoglycolate lyase
MNRPITIAPLTADAFAPFGDVIEASDAPTVMINQGKCARYTDLAALDFSDEGRAAISIFEGEPYSLPLTLDMMERHPLGSQAFLPMSSDPFLVIVAPDEDGAPGVPRAFLTKAGQGVNYRRNVWHGVLTPLGRKNFFAVVDRVGEGNNLQEHWFEEPYLIAES